MRYAIVKMGDPANAIDLPPDYHQYFHVVGMIGVGDNFIMTHASMDEVAEVRHHLHQVCIKEPLYSLNRVQYKDHPQFSINGNSWKELVEGLPVCWLAWYTGKPETLFFVPERFAEGVHYRRTEETLGVFDVTSKDVIFKAVCEHDCPTETIIKELL